MGDSRTTGAWNGTTAKRLDISLAALLFLLAIACSWTGFGLILRAPPEARVDQGRVPEMLAAAQAVGKELGLSDVSMRMGPGSIDFSWAAETPKPGLRLHFAPGRVGKADEMVLAEASEIPADLDVEHLKQAILSVGKRGIWRWEPARHRPDAMPRLSPEGMRRFLFLLGVCWLLIFLAGIGSLLTSNWHREDAVLLIPVLLLLGHALWIPGIPLDMKLHFLPTDLGRGDLPDVYGFGFPGFQMLTAGFSDAGPASLYAAIFLCALLALVLAYRLARDWTDSRLFAFLLTLILVSMPLWLRTVRSDSSHVPAFTAFLVGLSFFHSESAAWRYSRVLLAALALGLAMMTRAEFVVLPVIGFLAYAAVGWRRTLNVASLLAAGGALAAFLAPNYVWIAGLLGWQTESFLDAGATLQAVLGLSRGNLFFHPDFTPWFLMLFAGLGALELLIRKRFFLVGSAFLSAVLFLFHVFTIQPIFQSAHYQFLAWTPYALLAAYGFASRIEGLRKSGRKREAGAALVVLSVLLAGTPFLYPELLSKEPTTIHREMSFIEKNAASFGGDNPVFAFRESEDVALKNPENLLHALGVTSACIRTVRTEAEARKTILPGSLYYRGLACYTDPGLHEGDACRRFEKHRLLAPMATRILSPRPFGNERYPAAEVEIGLFLVLDGAGEDGSEGAE